MITHNINPNDISNYMDSLNKCINVYEFLHSSINNTNIKILNQIIPETRSFQSLVEIYHLFKDNIILEHLNSNVWNGIENNPFEKGVSKVLDDLQEEIDCDRLLLDNIINELSIKNRT